MATLTGLNAFEVALKSQTELELFIPSSVPGEKSPQQRSKTWSSTGLSPSLTETDGHVSNTVVL